MSNIICFNSSAPKEEWLTRSNQGTDCFLEVIIKAASDRAMTASQKNLINFLIERKDVNEIAPGTASFDIDEMPWNPCSLHEDVSYMLGIIEAAKDPNSWKQLDYSPNEQIIIPWLERFAEMIKKMD